MIVEVPRIEVPKFPIFSGGVDLRTREPRRDALISTPVQTVGVVQPEPLPRDLTINGTPATAITRWIANDVTFPLVEHPFQLDSESLGAIPWVDGFGTVIKSAGSRFADFDRVVMPQGIPGDYYSTAGIGNEIIANVGTLDIVIEFVARLSGTTSAQWLFGPMVSPAWQTGSCMIATDSTYDITFQMRAVGAAGNTAIVLNDDSIKDNVDHLFHFVWNRSDFTTNGHRFWMDGVNLGANTVLGAALSTQTGSVSTRPWMMNRFSNGANWHLSFGQIWAVSNWHQEGSAGITEFDAISAARWATIDPGP